MSLFREFDQLFDEMNRIHNQLWNDDWFTSRLGDNNRRLIRDKDDQKEIQQQNKVDNDVQTKPKEKEEVKQEERKEPETRVAKTSDNNNNKGLLSSLWSGLDVNKSITLKVDEQADKYIVSASIPEFNKDQLKLQIRDGLLSISGEMAEEHKDEHSYSKSSKYVSRSMKLPDNINEENINAKYENGVLSVNIPKLEKPKQQKKDTIMIE